MRRWPGYGEGLGTWPSARLQTAERQRAVPAEATAGQLVNITLPTPR